MSVDDVAPNPASSTSQPDVPHLDAKKKTPRKPKKSAPSDVRADDVKKFPWHKYPEATQFLCKIKGQLLDRTALSKKKRSDLKKDTANALLAWWDEHTLEHKNQGDMRGIIHAFYKNRLQFGDWHKYDGADPTASEATTADPPTGTRSTVGNPEMLDPLVAPLLQALIGRARSASALWADEHTEAVEARKRTMPRKLGTHQKAVAALFNELDGAEQDVWYARAEELKAAGGEDSEACFKNQEAFSELIGRFIQLLIGYGSKQIGAALVYMRIALRCKDGTIARDQLTIGADPSKVPYSEFQGGPAKPELDRWDDFLDYALPHIPSQQDERLVYTADDSPALPPYDQSRSTDFAIEVLDAWFNQLWEYGRKHGEHSLPEALDWEVVLHAPQHFMPREWLGAGLRRPSSYAFWEVPMIYHKLLSAQDTETAFRWKVTRALRPETSAPAHDMASVAPPITPSRSRVRTITIYSSPSKSLVSHQHEFPASLDIRPALPLCFENPAIQDSVSAGPPPTLPVESVASQSSVPPRLQPVLSVAPTSSGNSAQPPLPPPSPEPAPAPRERMADRPTTTFESMGHGTTVTASPLRPPTASPPTDVVPRVATAPVNDAQRPKSTSPGLPPNPVEPALILAMAAVVQAAPSPRSWHTPTTERALTPLSEPPPTPRAETASIPAPPVVTPSKSDMVGAGGQKRTAAAACNIGQDQPPKCKKKAPVASPSVPTQPSPRRLRSQRAPAETVSQVAEHASAKAGRARSGTAASKKK